MEPSYHRACGLAAGLTVRVTTIPSVPGTAASLEDSRHRLSLERLRVLRSALWCLSAPARGAHRGSRSRRQLRFRPLGRRSADRRLFSLPPLTRGSPVRTSIRLTSGEATSSADSFAGTGASHNQDGRVFDSRSQRGIHAEDLSPPELCDGPQLWVRKVGRTLNRSIYSPRSACLVH